MIRFAYLSLMTLLISLLAPPIVAEEAMPTEEQWQQYLNAMQPEKNNHARVVRNVYLVVKPTHEEEFIEIVTEVAMKAIAKTGQPGPSLYRMTSGEYDFLMIWPMPNDYSTLDWRTTEADIQFWRAMDELFGREKTVNSYNRYNELVVRTKVEYASQIAPAAAVD